MKPSQAEIGTRRLEEQPAKGKVVETALHYFAPQILVLYFDRNNHIVVALLPLLSIVPPSPPPLPPLPPTPFYHGACVLQSMFPFFVLFLFLFLFAFLSSHPQLISSRFLFYSSPIFFFFIFPSIQIDL